jgi:hypothetical protein
MSRLKILYLNAHGLNQLKYRYFIQLLDNNNIDIVAVSETWMPRSLSTIQCPYLTATSTNTRDDRTAGHALGGVSLFMRPAEQRLFQYTCSFDAVTAYTVTDAYIRILLAVNDGRGTYDAAPSTTGQYITNGRL